MAKTDLLEALNSFAEGATHLGQILGSESEGSNTGNNGEFGQAQSEQSVAS